MIKTIETPHGKINIEVVNENDADWMRLRLEGITAVIKVVAHTEARGNLSREARFDLQAGQNERLWPLPLPKLRPQGVDLRLIVILYYAGATEPQREEWVVRPAAQSLAEGAD